MAGTAGHRGSGLRRDTAATPHGMEYRSIAASGACHARSDGALRAASRGRSLGCGHRQLQRARQARRRTDRAEPDRQGEAGHQISCTRGERRHSACRIALRRQRARHDALSRPATPRLGGLRRDCPALRRCRLSQRREPPAVRGRGHPAAHPREGRAARLRAGHRALRRRARERLAARQQTPRSPQRQIDGHHRCAADNSLHFCHRQPAHGLMKTVLKRRCPDLIFVPPRFETYKAISLQIKSIFPEYPPIIEPLSLDEAYLDVTENLKGIASATRIAEEIRARIRTETELTASVGVSYNKFLAKLASDHRKPDGLFVITPAMGPAFVKALPVREFHGVGPATAAKMAQLGIKTGADLGAHSLGFLQHHFGKAGSYYYWAARGIDDRPVRANRIRKSIGAENTFAVDLFTYEAARDELREIVGKVWRYCENSDLRGRTIILKLKFANFRQITRSRTSQTQIGMRSELEQLADELLATVFPVTRS